MFEIIPRFNEKSLMTYLHEKGIDATKHTVLHFFISKQEEVEGKILPAFLLGCTMNKLQVIETMEGYILSGSIYNISKYIINLDTQYYIVDQLITELRKYSKESCKRLTDVGIIKENQIIGYDYSASIGIYEVFNDFTIVDSDYKLLKKRDLTEHISDDNLYKIATITYIRELYAGDLIDMINNTSVRVDIIDENDEFDEILNRDVILYTVCVTDTIYNILKDDFVVLKDAVVNYLNLVDKDVDNEIERFKSEFDYTRDVNRDDEDEFNPDFIGSIE